MNFGRCARVAVRAIACFGLVLVFVVCAAPFVTSYSSLLDLIRVNQALRSNTEGHSAPFPAINTETSSGGAAQSLHPSPWPSPVVISHQMTWPGVTSLSELPNILVVARHTENTSWIAQELPGWPHAIMQSGVAPLDTFHSREAGAYLQWIVEHYDALPRTITFIHAHRRTVMHTHNCDIVTIVRHLNYSAVRGVDGYASFALTPMSKNLSTECTTWYREHWQAVYQRWLPPLPGDVVYYSCCAQFIVERERILRLPLEFWQALLRSTRNRTLSDKLDLARCFEYSWPFIMGEPSDNRGELVHPPAKPCQVEQRHMQGGISNIGFADSLINNCTAYADEALAGRACQYLISHNLRNE